MVNLTLKLAMKYSIRFHRGKLVTIFALLISGCMTVPGYTPVGTLPRKNALAGPALGYNPSVAMNSHVGNYPVTGNSLLGSNPPSTQFLPILNPTPPSNTLTPNKATQELSSGRTEVVLTDGSKMTRNQMKYVNADRSSE
jgi:hypothetical protein